MPPKSLRPLIGFLVAASTLLASQMTRAQDASPPGPDFVYIGQLYGESQSGNFQQDKFLLLPRDFELDTSYEQRSRAACCGGGEAGCAEVWLFWLGHRHALGRPEIQSRGGH